MGDHICYYSDLNKMREHYPGWKITKSLNDIVEAELKEEELPEIESLIKKAIKLIEALKKRCSKK